MNVRYIGPHDAVEVDGVGIVKQGDVVNVPNALAGRPPSEDDLGVGLLAQPTNWVKVERSDSKTEDPK